MCCQFGVGAGVVMEQAEGVKQEKVVQLIFDPAEQAPAEQIKELSK
jgi:hypothetical protein